MHSDIINLQSKDTGIISKAAYSRKVIMAAASDVFSCLVRFLISIYRIIFYRVS